MKIRIAALTTAMLIILGADTAYADAVLYTPMLSPPTGGQLECHVTNVGKKTLTRATVFMVDNSGAVSVVCDDLASIADNHAGHTCSSGWGFDGLCKITVTGGNHRSVRAVLNVVDSSGATILSVPATK